MNALFFNYCINMDFESVNKDLLLEPANQTPFLKTVIAKYDI